MTEEHSLLADTGVWYSFSFVLLVIFMFFTARKGIVGYLDGQIAKIRQNLEEAQRLRDEAAATLEGYKGRQAEAQQQAKAIVAHAEQEAVRLRARAEEDLKKVMEQHEQKALDRIRVAEIAALDEVRLVVINQAIEAARAAIEKKLDGAMLQGLSDETISEISKLPMARG